MHGLSQAATWKNKGYLHSSVDVKIRQGEKDNAWLQAPGHQCSQINQSAVTPARDPAAAQFLPAFRGPILTLAA